MKQHPGDKILLDLLKAMEFCEVKPTNYSDESIEEWFKNIAAAKEYALKVKPRNWTEEQIIDSATD